jgi:hypothetical protein
MKRDHDYDVVDVGEIACRRGRNCDGRAFGTSHIVCRHCRLCWWCAAPSGECPSRRRVETSEGAVGKAAESGSAARTVNPSEPHSDPAPHLELVT